MHVSEQTQKQNHVLLPAQAQVVARPVGLVRHALARAHHAHLPGWPVRHAEDAALLRGRQEPRLRGTRNSFSVILGHLQTVCAKPPLLAVYRAPEQPMSSYILVKHLPCAS